MIPDFLDSNLATGVVGIVGVLVGVVVERIARSWGRLRCEPSEWRPHFIDPDPSSASYGETDRPEEATAVDYSGHLALFNGKEIPVALQDPSLVFVCKDGRKLVSKRVDDAASAVHRQGRTTYTPVYGINISPRQFLHKELRGGFGQEAVEALRTGRWKRIMFEAKRPKRPLFWRKTYRKTVLKP